MRRIIGIDPGLQHTGWGVIEQRGNALEYIACGTIHPSPKAALPIRLQTLHTELTVIMERYQPDEAAIEQIFVSVNAASTLKLGNARGALLLSLALYGTPIEEYDATLIKKSITGHGRADKQQMQTMVGILLPGCDRQAGADAMDALATAITHANHSAAKRALA